MNHDPEYDWHGSKRLAPYDPMVKYLIHAASVWGTDDYKSEPAHEHLWWLAQDYYDRDRCEVITKLVVSELIMGWDFNKFGGMPGGSPYSETTIRHYFNIPGGGVEGCEFNLSFGLSERYTPDGEMPENGSQWYVQVANDVQTHMAFTYIKWEDISVELIINVLNHFQDVSKSWAERIHAAKYGETEH